MMTSLVAQTVLRRIFPAAAVEEIIIRAGGENSAVYEVHTREPAQHLIIKVYPDHPRWKMDKEIYVYGLLEQAGSLPIPRVLLADDSRRLLARSYLVMTLLPGQVLSVLSPQLDDDQIYEIYRQMGALLAAIHQISQPAFGYLTTRVLDPLAASAAYMASRFDTKLREFTGLGGDPALCRRVERYLACHGQLLAACPAPVLCHNDYHEGNILAAPGGDGWQVSGIIDVENALAADPILDLAKTDYYAIRGNPAKRAALLDGYGTPSATWPGALPLYRLYHALELWDWYAATRQFRHLPGLADDIRHLATSDGPR
jgi:aminoglycoside phosphotransferase (APT) family kinase protein